MPFQWISIHAGPHKCQKYNKPTVVSVCSTVISRLVLGLPSRGDFENSPNDHDTWSVWCNEGIHVHFTSHLTFTCSIGPSSVVWSSTRFMSFKMWAWFGFANHLALIACFIPLEKWAGFGFANHLALIACFMSFEMWAGFEFANHYALIACFTPFEKWARFGFDNHLALIACFMSFEKWV